MEITLSKSLLIAVVLAPLVGSIIAGLFGRQVGRKGAQYVTILGVAVSCVLSCLTLYQLVEQGASPFNQNLYTFFDVGNYSAHVGFMVDRLTAMMMVVVTFVSLLVHIYTIGYMEEDPGYQRFFSYISLFTFSMLTLVMSNNFLQLFFGWEAVGLVSYLLIGFWFKRPTAVFANMKAFRSIASATSASFSASPVCCCGLARWTTPPCSPTRPPWPVPRCSCSRATSGA